MMTWQTSTKPRQNFHDQESLHAALGTKTFLLAKLSSHGYMKHTGSQPGLGSQLVRSRDF